MTDDELFEEYPLEIIDPYWKKQYDMLRKAGIPDFVAKPALIKAEREDSGRVAYR